MNTAQYNRSSISSLLPSNYRLASLFPVAEGIGGKNLSFRTAFPVSGRCCDAIVLGPSSPRRSAALPSVAVAKSVGEDGALFPPLPPALPIPPATVVVFTLNAPPRPPVVLLEVTGNVFEYIKATTRSWLSSRSRLRLCSSASKSSKGTLPGAELYSFARSLPVLFCPKVAASWCLYDMQ